MGIPVSRRLFGSAREGERILNPQLSCINFTDIRCFAYAYVIYDLEHRRNMDTIKDWYSRQGVVLHGRFGAFEYWNMDAVIRQSMLLAERLKSY